MATDDRTFTVGERAIELMKAYSHSAAPRSYELWFAYVSNSNPALNEAVKRQLAEHNVLSDRAVDELHESFLSNGRVAERAEEAGVSMLSKIEHVMGMIDTALGSTARYDASLQALSADLEKPTDGAGLRDILECLVVATREVAATNQALETRLRDSRGEIDELRETLETVRVESLTDPLTGIANRKHFDTMLETVVDSAHGSGERVALVVIDIDDFKRFNDQYGHAVGDQVLRLVASVMRETVSIPATLARFGGEEFGVILPGASSGMAQKCAESIRRSVEARELLKRSSGQSLGRITVSLGVASLRSDETANSLLERADECMYQAKRSGRNRTVSDADQAELSAA
jgi:diguanylate cyclase